MRVQHNIISMNSYRNYNNNTSQINRNIEKLSSGYKINRAGDDAAGLAISEKMRAQITGLQTAQKNAKDGISLVQTAEGALTEVHSMLNRMYQLAEQSANGTYDETTDRAQLQKEVSSLRTEINRIADSANFNGIKLLDGTMSKISVKDAGEDSLKSYTGFSILAEKKEDIQSFVTDMGASFDVTLTLGSNDPDNAYDGASVTFGAFDSLAEKGYTIEAFNSNGKNLADAQLWTAPAAADPDDTSSSATPSNLTFGESGTEFAHDGNHSVTFKISKDGKDIASISYRMDATASDLAKADDDSDGEIAVNMDLQNNTGLNLQIGDDANSWNKMNVSINDIHAGAMGIGNVDISEQDSAQAAMNAIKDAINYVSDVRGGLGATQNRLDHTISNLSVMEQNIQDAESTIRDTDVADEMMKYTKNSILVQSAQAMLAQANQQPQGVLQLLQ